MSRLEEKFKPYIRKMKAAQSPEVVINNFKHYYAKLSEGQTGLIPETEILPLDTLPDVEKLPPEKLTKIGEDKLYKAVIIKLNGGLGTSMGMDGAKCLLNVKKSFSFLDIIVRQSQSLGVPVTFMNSFSTQGDTLNALEVHTDLDGRNLPLDFLQHKIPKVDASDLNPVACPENPKLEWCPPGHGDIYPALVTSGMLDRLLKNGYEYAFVSNSDNLGAVMEPLILGYFVQNNLSFMMEAADRSEGDKKGGHVAQLKSGRLVLREIAQCPKEDMELFQNIQRHKYFNTNNIWIHLRSLKNIVNRKNGVLGLPMIRNRKTLDPRDPESSPVYKLETAMGAAISVFDNAGAVRVPRTRFNPVKSTNDLLAVRSDSYILNDIFQLVPNPQRKFSRILINLDPEYYTFIDEFEGRFPFGAPSLVNCESLTVRGDFKFGKGVILTGCVELFNDTGEAFEIEDHCRIEGESRI